MPKGNEKYQDPGYDTAFKLLFSDPAMIQSLIEEFAPQSWAAHLDFASLETTNVEHLSSDLKKRASDLIWKICCKESDIPLLVLIKFQSRVDLFMPLRNSVYSGLRYQALVRENSATIVNDKLPYLIPFVLYTGKTPWNAWITLEDCLGSLPPLKGIEKYQNKGGAYLLVDCCHQELNQYIVKKNGLALQLIRLERARTPAQVWKTIERLRFLLKEDRFNSLREAFVVFLRVVFKLEKRFPGVSFDTLEEIQSVFGEKIDQWEQRVLRKGECKGERKGLQQGMKQGVELGMKQGVHQGEVKLLLKLLIAKFKSLPMAYRFKLETADLETLDQWGLRLLSGASLEEIFGFPVTEALH